MARNFRVDDAGPNDPIPDLLPLTDAVLGVLEAANVAEPVCDAVITLVDKHALQHARLLAAIREALAALQSEDVYPCYPSAAKYAESILTGALAEIDP